MPDLAARLVRLESIVAIQQLMFRYAECVDLARFEDLGELFRHGSLGAVGAEPMQGAKAIRDFYAVTNKVHADGTLRTRHLATNAIIEIAPDAARATARSYFVVLQETPTLPLQAIVAGRYHDSFHVVDGAWSFGARLIHVDQVGDMSNHLSFDLRRDPIPKIG